MSSRALEIRAFSSMSVALTDTAANLQDRYSSRPSMTRNPTMAPRISTATMTVRMM
jgi:hypothetical protein